MSNEKEWRCVIEKGTIVNVRDANDGLVAHVGGDDVEQREKRARLLAAAPALFGLVVDRYSELAESPSARLDRLAEEFAHDVGVLAPGKDAPAAMGDGDELTRRDAWRDWIDARRAKELAAYRAVLSGVTGDAT